jgi:thiamine-monophosphate kinase
MKLKDLGEFGLIHRFAPFFSSHFTAGVEGIGDDCAVIPFQKELSYVITTDLLNENIHFIKSKIEPYDLGYKSLAVNISDIAAMGGRPLYAFLSLGLPPDTPIDWIDKFFAGFRQLADTHHISLLGGDTTRNQNVIINVLVIGVITTAHIKRRSQAQVGDIICCTSYVGDSGAGLKILLEELPQNALTQPLVQAHVRPRPHVEEGAWLATQPTVHAMMDISDGIASDIQRIMEASHCGVHIEIDHLPLSTDLKQACQQFGWQAEHLGLTTGEDYGLLATIDSQAFPDLQQAFQHQFQRPLFPIGTISATNTLEYTLNGKPFHLKESGFDHFH